MSERLAAEEGATIHGSFTLRLSRIRGEGREIINCNVSVILTPIKSKEADIFDGCRFKFRSQLIGEIV
jgi:hypothetical protein